MKTLVQLAKGTDKAIAAIHSRPDLPKGFDKRCQRIKGLGFKMMKIKDLCKLVSGHTPNQRMMVGVGGNSVKGVPTDQKYEWVYNHKTERIAKKEVWREATNYWHETASFMPDGSFLSYFTGYRGSSIATTNGGVVLGCIDYIKEKLPEEVCETIEKLKKKRIFNAFSLIARTDAWEHKGTEEGGIVIGNVWDTPEADRRKAPSGTLTYRQIQSGPIEAPQEDEKEAIFFINSW